MTTLNNLRRPAESKTKELVFETLARLPVAPDGFTTKRYCPSSLVGIGLRDFPKLKGTHDHQIKLDLKALKEEGRIESIEDGESQKYGAGPNYAKEVLERFKVIQSSNTPAQNVPDQNDTEAGRHRKVTSRFERGFYAWLGGVDAQHLTRVTSALLLKLYKKDNPQSKANQKNIQSATSHLVSKGLVTREVVEAPSKRTKNRTVYSLKHSGRPYFKSSSTSQGFELSVSPLEGAVEVPRTVETQQTNLVVEEIGLDKLSTDKILKALVLNPEAPYQMDMSAEVSDKLFRTIKRAAQNFHFDVEYFSYFNYVLEESVLDKKILVFFKPR